MSDRVEVKVKGPGRFFDRGWEPPAKGLTVKEAETLVKNCVSEIVVSQHRETMGSWWLADVLVTCEDKLGDRFSQITPDPKHSKISYLNLMRIARAFEDHSRRHSPDEASIWIHAEVIGVEEYKADELLESYIAGELKRDDLREEANKLRGTGNRGKSADEGDEDDTAGEPGEDKPHRDTCPLCLGKSEVDPELREAFVEFLALRENAKRVEA